MENLKTQIESVRSYAYKRLEDGDFNVIDCYYDENLESIRVVVEIDSYELDLIMLKKLNSMFQASGTIRNDIILFNNATETPTRIKELAEKKMEEYNSKQKELEIKRLEEKLKELKNQ